jgi:hypothetical protein
MKLLEIENFNNQITYEEGKIFFAANKGYTSKLMQRLYECGYRATTSGAMHYLYDDNGCKVTEAYSWFVLLTNTAIALS